MSEWRVLAEAVDRLTMQVSRAAYALEAQLASTMCLSPNEMNSLACCRQCGSRLVPAHKEKCPVCGGELMRPSGTEDVSEENHGERATLGVDGPAYQGT